MKGKRPKARALVLLSGGLDSRLVCRMMQEQLGKENVEAVFFMLPFGGGCCSDESCVFKFAQSEGIRLHIIDCTKGSLFRKYMNMIKKPEFSRGAGMNPCIDCHLFMLKEAKRLAKGTGAEIIATGEVLGERPLSQNRRALAIIEKEAGLGGRLLRPLSAKLLPETEAEKRGWIDRSKLLDMQGRRRARQIALAKKYGITFPAPAGGCLLTDREFSRRLRKLLGLKSKINMEEIGLLKLGRHFARGKSLIVVGRNEKENKQLLSLAKTIRPAPAVMEVTGQMGPATLVINPAQKSVKTAARLTVRYSDAPKNRPASVQAMKGREQRIMKAKALSEAQIAKLRA